MRPKIWCAITTCLGCAVVLYTDPLGDPIVVEESLHGRWQVVADLKRVPGLPSGQLPLAPDERVAFWQDLLCLVGEWIRRPESSPGDRHPGPLDEDAARGRAFALYREEFGCWPTGDGLVFVPRFEPASVAIRERSRRRFRKFWDSCDREAQGSSGADPVDSLVPWDGATTRSPARDCGWRRPRLGRGDARGLPRIAGRAEQAAVQRVGVAVRHTRLALDRSPGGALVQARGRHGRRGRGSRAVVARVRPRPRARLAT